MGDIVTMPLPTEWAPEVAGSGGGVPFRFVLGNPPGMVQPGMLQPGAGQPGIDPANGPGPLQSAAQVAEYHRLRSLGVSPYEAGRRARGWAPPDEYYGAGFPPSGSVSDGPAGAPGGPGFPSGPGGQPGAQVAPAPSGWPGNGPASVPAWIPGGWVPGSGSGLPAGEYPGAGYPDAYAGHPAGGVPSGSGPGGLAPGGLPVGGLAPGGLPSGAPGTPGATPGAFVPGGLRPGMTVNGLVIPQTVSSQARPGSPAVQGWAPNLIYPNWMLPAALDRSNPLVHRNVWIPNKWDYRLRYECLLWQWMAAHGGLRSCCRVPDLGAPIWDQPPWEVMPSQGVQYRKMFSQPIAAVSGGGPFDGTDTVLGRFNIPNGYDAVLNQFVCKFTGTGFDEFAGEIFWRVRVDNRFAKDLGNVTNTYGSYEASLLVPGYGIRLVSGQTVYLIANIPAGSPVAGGVVSAGVFGWWYPRR